ncbi:MAG: hypothetical protein VYD85_01075, partial [Pseudomonadota bacterium]|nr:hypothetical protein [Pseudomonadota bacterium]
QIITIKSWQMRHGQAVYDDFARLDNNHLTAFPAMVLPVIGHIRMRHSCYAPRRSVIHDRIARMTQIFRRKT